jgi:hypothetical protein
MKRFLLWLSAAAVFVGALCGGTQASAAQASAAMSVRFLSATGPHTVSTHGVITFHVQVSGMTLKFKAIGKHPVSGQGHLQYYLDGIPSDAYKRADLRHNFLGVVATPIYIFHLKYSLVKIKPGKHRFIAALAQNDNVLYHVPTASITVTVK